MDRLYLIIFILLILVYLYLSEWNLFLYSVSAFFNQIIIFCIIRLIWILGIFSSFIIIFAIIFIFFLICNLYRYCRYLTIFMLSGYGFIITNCLCSELVLFINICIFAKKKEFISFLKLTLKYLTMIITVITTIVIP